MSQRNEIKANSGQLVAPRVLASSATRGWRGLSAEFVHLPQGKSENPGRDRHILGMHFGRAVNADCAAGGQRAKGLQKAGDIGFVPAGVDGYWEDDADVHILRLSLAPLLLHETARDLGIDESRIELNPQLHFRDTGIEGILHAIKADLDAAEPSDPLFVGHLSHALAIRLLMIATGKSSDPALSRQIDVPAAQLARAIDFIEANLDKKLHLAELAAVAGISVTRLKTAFRITFGTPVHQYVIRRRVEYARRLIATTSIPVSEIALAAGFSHQSHMANLMRRELGHTPGDITRPGQANGPILQKIRPNMSDWVAVGS